MSESPEGRAARRARSDARRALTMPPLVLTREQWETVEQHMRVKVAGLVEVNAGHPRDDLNNLYQETAGMLGIATAALGRPCDERARMTEVHTLEDGRISAVVGNLVHLDTITDPGIRQAVRDLGEEHSRQIRALQPPASSRAHRPMR